MPYSKIQLCAAAVLFIAGCATPNFFTASSGSKTNADPNSGSGPRASSFTNSWSGTQYANSTPQDAGAAAAASERRIQELLAAGKRSQNAGDRRAARTAYEQVLRVAPGDAYANYQLAKIDDDEGRFADAERHYFTVMRQTPNDPDILSSLGWSYYLSGRYDDADRVLREALRYDDKHRVALNNLGWLYGARGDYDAALKIFREAGSEADAQQLLAAVKQNAAPVPAAGEQFANVPVTSEVPPGRSAAGVTIESRGAYATGEPESATPQGRKFAEDLKRLKAERDKQQDIRGRMAQKNISAPSPWNNNRPGTANSGQRDAGQTMRVAGQADFPPAASGSIRGSMAIPAQINGRFPATDAAFPGAAPSQANRPRLADPIEFAPAGNAHVPAGNLPILTPGTQSISGTRAIYQQPAGAQGQGAPGQTRLPIITPAGESPSSRGAIFTSPNSLPPDDSNRGNSNGWNVLPETRSAPEWPRNLRQDARTTAAQLGLSAGSGDLGFPASEWPSSASGQIAGPANGQSPMGVQNPTAGQNQASQNPNNPQSAGQQPSTGGQPQGLGSSSPMSNNPGSSLPAWPGRPLTGGSVPQAVVPSAQGVVNGSTGDSGTPNFYSGRPALPPVRQQ